MKPQPFHRAIRKPETGVVKVEVSPAGDLVWLERSLEVLVQLVDKTHPTTNIPRLRDRPILGLMVLPFV